MSDWNVDDIETYDDPNETEDDLFEGEYESGEGEVLGYDDTSESSFTDVPDLTHDTETDFRKPPPKPGKKKKAESLDYKYFVEKEDKNLVSIETYEFPLFTDDKIIVKKEGKMTPIKYKEVDHLNYTPINGKSIRFVSGSGNSDWVSDFKSNIDSDFSSREKIGRIEISGKIDKEQKESVIKKISNVVLAEYNVTKSVNSIVFLNLSSSGNYSSEIVNKPNSILKFEKSGINDNSYKLIDNDYMILDNNTKVPLDVVKKNKDGRGDLYNVIKNKCKSGNIIRILFDDNAKTEDLRGKIETVIFNQISNAYSKDAKIMCFTRDGDDRINYNVEDIYSFVVMGSYGTYGMEKRKVGVSQITFDTSKCPQTDILIGEPGTLYVIKKDVKRDTNWLEQKIKKDAKAKESDAKKLELEKKRKEAHQIELKKQKDKVHSDKKAVVKGSIVNFMISREVRYNGVLLNNKTSAGVEVLSLKDGQLKNAQQKDMIKLDVYYNVHKIDAKGSGTLKSSYFASRSDPGVKTQYQGVSVRDTKTIIDKGIVTRVHKNIERAKLKDRNVYVYIDDNKKSTVKDSSMIKIDGVYLGLSKKDKKRYMYSRQNGKIIVTEMRNDPLIKTSDVKCSIKTDPQGNYVSISNQKKIYFVEDNYILEPGDHFIQFIENSNKSNIAIDDKTKTEISMFSIQSLGSYRMYTVPEEYVIPVEDYEISEDVSFDTKKDELKMATYLFLYLRTKIQNKKNVLKYNEDVKWIRVPWKKDEVSVTKSDGDTIVSWIFEKEKFTERFRSEAVAESFVLNAFYDKKLKEWYKSNRSMAIAKQEVANNPAILDELSEKAEAAANEFLNPVNFMNGLIERHGSKLFNESIYKISLTLSNSPDSTTDDRSIGGILESLYGAYDVPSALGTAIWRYYTRDIRLSGGYPTLYKLKDYWNTHFLNKFISERVRNIAEKADITSEDIAEFDRKFLFDKDVFEQDENVVVNPVTGKKIPIESKKFVNLHDQYRSLISNSVKASTSTVSSTETQGLTKEEIEIKKKIESASIPYSSSEELNLLLEIFKFLKKISENVSRKDYVKYCMRPIVFLIHLKDQAVYINSLYNDGYYSILDFAGKLLENEKAFPEAFIEYPIILDDYPNRVDSSIDFIKKSLAYMINSETIAYSKFISRQSLDRRYIRSDQMSENVVSFTNYLIDIHKYTKNWYEHKKNLLSLKSVKDKLFSSQEDMHKSCENNILYYGKSISHNMKKVCNRYRKYNKIISALEKRDKIILVWGEDVSGDNLERRPEKPEGYYKPVPYVVNLVIDHIIDSKNKSKSFDTKKFPEVVLNKVNTVYKHLITDEMTKTYETSKNKPGYISSMLNLQNNYTEKIETSVPGFLDSVAYRFGFGKSAQQEIIKKKKIADYTDTFEHLNEQLLEAIRIHRETRKERDSLQLKIDKIESIEETTTIYDGDTERRGKLLRLLKIKVDKLEKELKIRYSRRLALQDQLLQVNKLIVQEGGKSLLKDEQIQEIANSGPSRRIIEANMEIISENKGKRENYVKERDELNDKRNSFARNKRKLLIKEIHRLEDEINKSIMIIQENIKNIQNSGKDPKDVVNMNKINEIIKYSKEKFSKKYKGSSTEPTITKSIVRNSEMSDIIGDFI